MARRKSKKVTNLTPSMLRKMIVQERRRLRETSDPIEAGVEDPEKVSADEVDADKQADTLAKDIDHLKVLKVQEAKLRNKLREVSNRRRTAQKRIKSKL
jgi:phage/plasmid primase-like uncharacterized protein